MKRWHQLLFAIFGLILIITAWQRNQEPYWLHDISLSSRQEAALTFYDQVWGKLKSLYLDSSLNHQNWDYWRTRYGKNIQTMQDAYVAVQTMITSLNDPYTRLLVPENATQQIAVTMAPGFLESSEEIISMKPYREHPKGLAAYK